MHIQRLFAFAFLGSIFVYSSAFATSSTSIVTSSNSEQSREFFKNLKGCFAVTFDYIEDGKNDQYIDGLYEWVTSLQGDPETSLQHIGVAGGQAFKHWREEWHENSDGTWYQKVTGPAGNFRYECAAPMYFNQWRCSVKNAPKPRRDAGRSDYEKIDRENTLQVTPKGWVQAENNIKRDKDGKAVSNEIGWNKYHRVDESNCQAAEDFLAGHSHP